MAKIKQPKLTPARVLSKGALMVRELLLTIIQAIAATALANLDVLAAGRPCANALKA
jgi:hypothetical protein